MKVYTEFSLEDFDAWSGGEDTKNTIIEKGKAKEFECMVEELFPDGASETDINDFLWFDDDFIFSSLGIREEDEEEEEE